MPRWRPTYLPQYCLADQELTEHCFGPEKLLGYCNGAGMDSFMLHLYHCDLGSGSVIVGLENDTLGTIHFDRVGYVPNARIRTKF